MLDALLPTVDLEAELAGFPTRRSFPWTICPTSLTRGYMLHFLRRGGSRNRESFDSETLEREGLTEMDEQDLDSVLQQRIDNDEQSLFTIGQIEDEGHGRRLVSMFVDGEEYQVVVDISTGTAGFHVDVFTFRHGRCTDPIVMVLKSEVSVAAGLPQDHAA